MLQDEQPSNLCPGYLAALPSTGDVLAALQQAYKAKMAILAKSGPVQQQTIKLAPLIPGPFSSWEGQKVAVKQVAFSADSQYLALGLLCCATHQQQVSNNVAACLVVTATGRFEKQACICGPPGSCDAKIQWAADASLLTIAHKTRADMPDSLPAEQASLRVLDAATGHIVHAVGPSTEAALRQGFRKAQRFSQMELSPSGSMLLVTSCCWEDPQDARKGQGYLLVLDVMQDKIVLQSEISLDIPVQEEQRLMYIMGLSAWHPSSEGLVFSYCVDLQPEEIAEPGLAVAVLPEACYIITRQTTTFSPDGQRLAVSSLEGSDSMTAEFCILRCSITGMTMTLVPELWIGHVLPYLFAGYGSQWLPCSSRLLLGLRGRKSLMVDLDGEEINTWQVLSPPLRFNSSQQLLIDSSGPPRILKAANGEELWAAGAGR